MWQLQDLSLSRLLNKHSMELSNYQPIRSLLHQMPQNHNEVVKKRSMTCYEPSLSTRLQSGAASSGDCTKEGKRTRFCIDYWALNKRMTADIFPIPSVDEILDRMAGSTISSMLDLFESYWQVQLVEHMQEMPPL